MMAILTPLTMALAATGVCAALLTWFVCHDAPRLLAQRRAAFTAQTHARLGELFLFINPARVWTLSLIFCLVAALGVIALTGSLVLAVAAASAALLAPRGLSIRWRRQRRKRFDAQLPDTLAALAAALRAGAALPSALRVIVSESDAPLAQEFGLMLREQRLGVPFEDALANLHTRMPTPATGLVVAVLRIAAHTGGNLADTLERIAATLRARLQWQGRVQSLTAQGRMQAWVLAGLPLLLLLALDALEPEAMAALWHTPPGWGVLASIVVLEALGVVWIRRIVAIDI